MKAYLDITLLPSDDIGHHFLWGKVYQQIHLALVENKSTDDSSPYGVTFPEFHAEKHRLGRKLRVFAPDQLSLEKLNLPRWLDRLLDYVHLTSIRDTPDTERYVCFSRLRTKSNKERLARRTAKKRSISYQQALEEWAEFVPKHTDAPFIQLQSLENGHRFKLFISMKEETLLGKAPGKFNTYGLSKNKALPKF